MGCLISRTSSRKTQHHYSSDSTATLRRAPPPGCRPSKSNLFPSRPQSTGTKTRSSARKYRRRQDDSIPKLPKTFFATEMQSNRADEDDDGEVETSRAAVTPSTTDLFSESMAAAEWSESPVHWGVWRRKEAQTIPLVSEVDSFVAGLSPAVGDVGERELAAEKRRVEAAVAMVTAEQGKSKFGFGRGSAFRKEFSQYKEWSPVWTRTPAVGSFAIRSPARGSPFNGSGRTSSRWSGRAIGSGVKICILNDDVCLKRWEQGDQSLDGGSYISMECFVF